MSSLLLICLLLLGTSVHAIPSFTRNYTSSQQLMSGYTIFWRVNETSQEIYLGFQVQTTGWFGFGIAEPESGSMPGADIMTAYVSGSRTSVTDRFSTGFTVPSVDSSCQDWQVVYGAEADGYTVVEVTRKLDTGDHVQDRVIASGSIPIIFAYSPSNSDTLGYHRTNRGTGFITFYGTPQPIPSDLLQDRNVVVSFAQVSGYQIPAQQTTYMCQSFELPIDQIRHIIAFEPVVNSTNSAMVHHGLVHGCSSDSTFWSQYLTPGPCESPVGFIASKCSDLLFGWARGGEAMFLPPEAGFRVSNSSEGYYRILVQMHYDNPALSATSVDHSGFKLYMTSQLRPHDAGVITLGDPFTRSLPIPARSPYTEYEYACSPTCTSLKFNNTLQVFSSFPHMHMYGSRIWTTRWRNGEQLPQAVRTEYFAWTIQKNIPVNYTIMPGDRLNTHCAYDTTSTNMPVTFGKNSTQEMCMEFISYWPKQTGMYYCGAAHFEAKNLTVCGERTLQPPEIDNPSRWGYDPANQRSRTFGNEIAANATCTVPVESSSSSTGGASATASSSTSVTSSSSAPAVSSSSSSSSSSSMSSQSSSTGLGLSMASNMIPTPSSVMMVCAGWLFMTWLN